MDNAVDQIIANVERVDRKAADKLRMYRDNPRSRPLGLAWGTTKPNLTDLFIWVESKEGHAYWYDINAKLEAKQEPHLSERVAELERELAELRAKAGESSYDYENPRRGDLFKREGIVFLAVPTQGEDMDDWQLVSLAGAKVGASWVPRRGFRGSESEFEFLGNCEDKPGLLLETLKEME